MNSLKHIYLLILILGLISCEKEESNNRTNNLRVETYIDLLKSNQYDSLTLPMFTYEDIPALLQYRDENQIITNSPCNPISSLYEPECKLGLYVLWTIESIRAESIKSKYLFMGFPSQNPILALRDSDGLNLISGDVSHKIAADAYNDWWNNNKNKNFDDFKNIDPLENTDYRWH